MIIRDRLPVILASTLLSFLGTSTLAQDGAVVMNFPSANQQLLAQQQAQQNMMPYGTAGGYYPQNNPGYYSPAPAMNPNNLGNVALCGSPPYVYPCAYGAPQTPQYSSMQTQAPLGNAARPAETFGLASQSAQQVATFTSQPSALVDQSPSTTSDGFGNTAGPIIAAPVASGGNFSGGSYTRSDIMNSSSSFYAQSGQSAGTNVKQSQIRNAAYQIGVRAGFAAEAQRINNSLLKYRYAMDQRYNFSEVMEEGGYVVPPVITTATNIVERRAANVLFTTTGSYEIVQPAYVTVKKPTWQDYMMLEGDGPTPPSGIKIKDKADKAVWSEAAKNGWDRGIGEARAQFVAGLDRLQRDFEGMKTYHRLADAGAVSLTKVSVSVKDGEIYLGGRKATGTSSVLKITVSPKFKSKLAVAVSMEKDRANTAAPKDR